MCVCVCVCSILQVLHIYSIFSNNKWRLEQEMHQKQKKNVSLVNLTKRCHYKFDRCVGMFDNSVYTYSHASSGFLEFVIIKREEVLISSKSLSKNICEAQTPRVHLEDYDGLDFLKIQTYQVLPDISKKQREFEGKDKYNEHT